MTFRSLAIAVSLALTAPIFAEPADEFVINLKDPQYSDGIIETTNGGVISAPCLRIQACKIIYTNTKTEQKICAEGDLMLEYQDRIFVGEKLEYDLVNKTGFLTNGRTKDGGWYLGGDWIELQEDGSFFIYGSYLTTSVSRSNPWKISAKSAEVTDESQLTAKDVRFKVLNFPLLWLPSYKTDLSGFRHSPIRYRLLWDKGLGPRLSTRYRFYSNENFNAYARFDLRYNTQEKQLAPGGAIEADYLSDNKRTVFQMGNYGALDKIFPDENGEVRYRFQGIFKTKSADGYTKFHVQWDKLSDSRMISDFKSPDFEINTQKTTFLEFSHYHDWSFADLTVRPRINDSQSLAQELPSGVLGLRPFEVWRSGVIMENYASGSYLDYSYANTLGDILSDPKSGRLETLNSLYRPFSLGGATITPRAGLIGIYYSNGPDRNAVGQWLYTYGGDANIRFSKVFPKYKHTVIPYAEYLGYTKPMAQVGDYFVFDIHDGYDRVDQLRFGVRQLLFSKENSIFLPGLTLDLYAYSFWGASSFNQNIPKVFADFELNQQSYAFKTGLGYNIQETVLDYGNAEFLWTLNADFAFGVEFRYRSKFWWRKSIHDNYVVDFARPLDDLLASPLSDRRYTFLTKAHWHLTPRWNLQLQTFHGWDRDDEPNYNGAKLDLYTMLTGQWQMKLTYEYMPNDPIRFSYSFKLVK
ncbi:MAG: hypothetical protein P0S96_03485 [Simkaniaceae bacterium]|nr:hypothetical protein [Candidatus Sacchlamyda saccharinae]